jgi:hypothetical protein
MGHMAGKKKSKLTQWATRPVLLLFLKVNGPLRPVKKNIKWSNRPVAGDNSETPLKKKTLPDWSVMCWSHGLLEEDRQVQDLTLEQEQEQWLLKLEPQGCVLPYHILMLKPCQRQQGQVQGSPDVDGEEPTSASSLS